MIFNSIQLLTDYNHKYVNYISSKIDIIERTYSFIPQYNIFKKEHVVYEYILSNCDELTMYNFLKYFEVYIFKTTRELVFKDNVINNMLDKLKYVIKDDKIYTKFLLCFHYFF